MTSGTVVPIVQRDLGAFDYSMNGGSLGHILGKGPDVIALRGSTSLANIPGANSFKVNSSRGLRQRTQNWRTVGDDLLASQLAHRLIELKAFTSQVAMHLSEEWRAGLFRQLDFLMAPEQWVAIDPIPAADSYRTALRLVIFFGHIQRPGLGFDQHGHIVLAWTRGSDRLTLECEPNDSVRWFVSQSIEGERETAVGKAKVTRLRDVLGGFGLDKWLASP